VNRHTLPRWSGGRKQDHRENDQHAQQQQEQLPDLQSADLPLLHGPQVLQGREFDNSDTAPREQVDDQRYECSERRKQYGGIQEVEHI